MTLVPCLFLFAVALGAAEPPPEASYPPASGPYPPSGWRPSGRLLVLPARQTASPRPVYGPPPPQPPPSYGPPPPQPPPQEYGPPSTEPTTDEPTEPPTEQPEDGSEAPTESEQLVDRGVYYVLKPDGRLQMVRYTTAPLRSQKKKAKDTPQQQKFQGNRFADFESQRIQQDKTQEQKQAQLSQIQAHHAQFQFNQKSEQFNQKPAQFNQRPLKNTQAKFQQNQQFNQRPTKFNQQPARVQQQPFHYVEIQKSHEIEVAQPPPERAPEGFIANLKYRDVEPISAPVYALNPNPLVRVLKK